MTKEDQILEILHEHTKILMQHTQRFDMLEEKFNGLEDKFGILESKFNGLEDKFGILDETVNSLNNAVLLLESEFKDKSSALFDGHSINQDHLERNDEDIKDLQTVSENHSIRLISLEIDSKEHTKQLQNLSSK